MRVNNDFDAVEANLGKIPTDATIQAAAEKAGYSFDPETQYVRWYVIKWSSNAWHVDRSSRKNPNIRLFIIRIKELITSRISYSMMREKRLRLITANFLSETAMNLPAGTEIRTAVTLNTRCRKKGRKPVFVMPEEDVDLYAIWKPSNNTRITVEHYWQRTDADQAASADDFEYYESIPAYATTGETVYDKEYKMDYLGFTYQEGIVDGRSSETVEADGSTVLKLYYTRNSNTQYRVEHYIQDLDADTYSLEEGTTGTGITGRTAEYEPNTYPGFE